MRLLASGLRCVSTTWLLISVSLVSLPAPAQDRAACKAGDQQACARLGQLKQVGALKNGTKDVAALVEACGRALDQAANSRSMRAVNRACTQLFSPELQRGWDAVVDVEMSGLENIIGAAWAEAYCPRLQTKTAGCKGLRAADFRKLSPRERFEALKQLTKASLALELGTETASTLAPKFDRAWAVMLGAP